ncbi:hypothetical protein CHLNCDRAFT_143250 [Chlorella variabilis]|uniref:Uncharacterized protein n=1 Tax=Chlorella variabilis TaxID=554065 RepID=E1Z9T7_CHLVA|nr:hypothetical protein CHLNCDRAFT_143250 [Chlorella variabilis]EFN57579.1 hypothetical protein CHLNCDRAFT_143250 [Chlorella variabilis]|eukprot:XP_005849681.1 hypothetical protein CHLNCDRAFT_143250 [Chlorella variabilis]
MERAAGWLAGADASEAADAVARSGGTPPPPPPPAHGDSPPPLEDAPGAAAGEGPPPPGHPADGAQTAAAAAPPAEAPLLDLPALRQMFFDQPTSPPDLRRRLAELEELRRCRVFTDNGALWDLMLGPLRRYLLLLERQAAAAADTGHQQQQAAESGASAVSLACDMCRGPPPPGTQLRRMQLIGRPEHMAVCGACAERQHGLLVPLTPTWEIDANAWQAIQQALAARQQQQQQPRGGAGRGSRSGAVARPASACSSGSHRGRARFQATSQAWLKELTKGNVEPSNGPKPRVYLPFGVYWFWVDRLLGDSAELATPLVMRVRQAGSTTTAAGTADPGAGDPGSGAVAAPAWDIRLLKTDDGMQLQPAGLRVLLEQLGAGVGSRLLFQLEEGRCSAERLQATVKLIGSGEPLPELPGDPVEAPRGAVALAGLAGSKKRKGGYTKHPADAASEFFYGWDESWDEEVADDAALQSMAVHTLDGPSGAGRSKRRGAGGRLASILRQELPQYDDPDDGDFLVGAEAQGGEELAAAADDARELPFQPRRTASVEEAALLAADLEAEAEVEGAHPPPPGTAHKWGVYVKCAGVRKAWYGRLDRQRAAVAADLVLLWQQETQPAAAGGPHQRQMSLRDLLAAKRGEDVDAGTSSSSEEESSSLREEVQAMQAAAAALMTTAGSGGCSPRGSGGAPEAGPAPRGGRGRAPPAQLNLPGALLIHTPQQMISFLSVVVPQDPLPHPRGAALAHARSLDRPQDEGQQAAQQEPEQQQQGGPGQQPAQQPRQQQRKRKHAQPVAAQPGRPPLPPPQAQQRPADAAGQRRRVGVVFYEDTQTWAGAAAGRTAAGQLVPLRVEGLPTSEQAEVARDLLAVWGWLAQGGVLPGAHADDANGSGGAGEGGGAGGLARQASTASSSGAGPAEAAGPPVPPLNHPLNFYAKWAADLRQLGVREVEPYVKVVAEEVSTELATLLPPSPKRESSPAADAKLDTPEVPPAKAAPAAPAPAEAATPAHAAKPAPAVQAASAAPAHAGSAAPSARPVGQGAVATGAGAAGAALPLDLLDVLASAASGEAPAGPPPAAQAAPAEQPGLAAKQEDAPHAQPQPAASREAPAAPVEPSRQPEAPPAAPPPGWRPHPQQRPELHQPAPLLPTAGSGGGSGSLQGSGGSGGLLRAPSTVSERAAQAAERKVQQALAAFAAADMESGDSMLRPLRLLVLANKGGQTLRDVVQRWASYSLTAQQDVFDAALIGCDRGEFDQLEEQLLLAL